MTEVKMRELGHRVDVRGQGRSATRSQSKVTLHDIHLAIKLHTVSAEIGDALLHNVSLHMDQCLFGTTALSLSLYYRCEEAFNLILDRHVRTAAVDLDRLSFDAMKRHEPALVTAVRLGNKAAVCRLLECGANIESVDGLGHTPLWTAARERQFDIALTLLRHGAVVRPGTPQRACALPVFAASRLSSRRTDLARLMIVAGADERTVDGQSLLTRLLGAGRLTAVRLLLSACRVRRPSQPSLTTGDLELDRLVSEHFSVPPTLLTQCRWALRLAVVKATHGRHIVAALSHLPLPRTLLDYLMLVDVLQFEHGTTDWEPAVQCLARSTCSSQGDPRSSVSQHQ